MTAHFTGQRGSCFFHLRLDQRMPRTPHQRRSAQDRHAIEQGLAGLHIGDDCGARPFRQHFTRQHQQDLIAPDHPAATVDHPNSVAIAVEGDPKIAALFSHGRLQVDEVLFFRRIGVMVGKVSVHIPEQNVVRPRQTGGQRIDHSARGPIADIPRHVQIAGLGRVLQHARDVFG